MRNTPNPCRTLLLCLLAALALSAAGCTGLLARFPDAAARAEWRAEARREQILARHRERDAALRKASQPEEMTIAEHLRNGNRARNAGDISRAYADYVRAHWADQGDPVPLRRMAFLTIRKDPAEAEQLFQELIAERADEAILFTGLGLARLARDDVDGARAAFQNALALDPRSAATHSSLGVVYDRMGEHDQAQVYFYRALDLKPNDPDLLNNLGVSHLLAGNYEIAAQAFEMALARGSRDPALQNNMGLALGLSGRYPEALGAFRAAGSQGDAYNNIGYVYYVRGDYAAAIRSYEYSLLSDDTDERRVLGNLLRAQQARDRKRP